MSELASNNYKKTQRNDVKTNIVKGGKKKRTQRKKRLTLKRRKIR